MNFIHRAIDFFHEPEEESDEEFVDATFNEIRRFVDSFSEGTVIDLLDWLFSFTTATNSLNVDEKTIAKIFPRFLGGTARLRFQRISTRKRKVWNQMLPAFLVTFHSSIDWILADAKLGKLTQGMSSLAEYAANIKTFGVYAYPYLSKKNLEKRLVSHFIGNCNRTLKAKLLSLSPCPTTLEEAVQRGEELQEKHGRCEETVHKTELMESVNAISLLLKNFHVHDATEHVHMIATVDLPEDEIEIPDVCYFHKQRRNVLETEDRHSKSEVSVNCNRKLQKLSEVLSLDKQLFGAPDAPSLIIFRGSGTKIDSIQNWADKQICSNHVDELFLKWSETSFNHIYRTSRIIGQTILCTASDHLPNPHGSTNRTIQKRSHHVLQYNEAVAVLKKHGALLHPGIPLCLYHKRYVENLLSESSGPEHNSPEPAQLDLEIVATDQPCSSNTPVRSHKNSNSELERAVYGLGNLVGLQRLKSVYPFDVLSRQSQLKKARAVRKIVDAIIAIVAPGSEELLSEMIFPNTSKTRNQKDLDRLNTLLTHVAAEFRCANSRHERNIVLSLVAKVFPYSQVCVYIIGLTFYMYDQARRMTTYKEPTRKRHRCRFHAESVHLFLYFITSNLIMSPFTFGSKKARTSSGEVVELPNTIRKQTHAQILAMFRSYVKEVGKDVILSDSTCFRILEYCSATPMRAATCVDYFLAQALESRNELIQIIGEWENSGEIDEKMRKSLQKELENLIHYFRSDYRIHVKVNSPIADHCCTYALSDPSDVLLSTQCNHVHDKICDKCEMAKTFFSTVESVLAKIIKRFVFLSEKGDEDAEIQMHKYVQQEQDLKRCRGQIESFKKHILRSVFTDNERSRIIEQLQDDEAMLTLDFAQKLLVQKHYETQKNYFGKRGMSYHITHVIAKVEGVLVTHSFVHILRGDLQDTLAVTAMIEHSLTELKKMGIKSVTLRSDNAGNYHCNQTLSSLISIMEKTGVKLKRYAFSEAQNGKSSCDRVASVVKRKIRIFVDNGNDVENVEDFMSALKKSPITATSVFLASVDRSATTKKSVIKNISSMHDLTIGKTEMVALKYKGIGPGIKIQKKNLVANKSKLIIEDVSVLHASEQLSKQERKNLKKTNATEFWHSIQNEKEDEKKNSVNQKDNKTVEEGDDHQDVYFPCPQEGCISRFRRFTNLEKHVTIGKHKCFAETVSLRDNVIYSYRNLTNDIKNEFLPQAVSDAIETIIAPIGDASLIENKGWALTTRKAAKRFNEKQKQFLQKLFETGEQNKAKFNGGQVEKMMRNERDSKGKPVFTPEEFLDSAQIDSYFSRLAFKRKTNATSKDKNLVQRCKKTVKGSNVPRETKQSTNNDNHNEEEENDSDYEFDDDENSLGYCSIGFKDAMFPDLLSEAEKIIRDNSSELFDRTITSPGKLRK